MVRLPGGSRILTAALAGVALTAAGCADSTQNGSSADEHVYFGSSVVNVDSADNAVTWSDTVVGFTVVSEREAVSETSEEEGGSAVGRLVTIKVGDIVWNRDTGKQPPASFETQAPGWYRDGDSKQLIPMRNESGIRMEVGKTYIAPVVYVFGQWGFDDSVLEVADGQVIVAPQQDFALAAELDGKSVEDAAKVFSVAHPAPESGPLRGTTEEQLEAIGVDVG